MRDRRELFAKKVSQNGEIKWSVRIAIFIITNVKYKLAKIIFMIAIPTNQIK